MKNTLFQISALTVLFAIFLATQMAVGQKKTDEKKSTKQEKSKVDQVKDAKIGNTKNVHQCGNLFLAGQFTKEDLDEIAAKKISRVITLRTEGEVKWDEEGALKSAKMELIKVPFRKPESLTDEVFGKVRKLLADKSKPTLFHCGSANRVGGVWLPYRVLDEGVDLETALKEAKTIGLRTKFIEEKAIDYIKRMQKKAQGKSGSKKKK